MNGEVTEGTVLERTELLVPGPAEALGGLLGVPVPDLAHGESLPLLWHWLYLLDRPAQSDLGRDGHPVRGSMPAPQARDAGGCGPVAGCGPRDHCAAAYLPPSKPAGCP
jgi:hypothetical protein